MRLADGRRAFFKGHGLRATDFIRFALEREERVYRELGELIGPWAPGLLGSLALHGWCALLLEDLGPKSAPPWTAAMARGVMRQYAAFHRWTVGRELPAWVPPLMMGRGVWEAHVGEVAGLAGPRAAEAARWLEAAVPVLRRASRSADSAVTALIHCDTRSDNLRWRTGKLYLLDWPHVRSGPPEYDLAGFAQSIAVDGGPAPETLVSWYGPHSTAALDAAVAELAGFFAAQAGLPPVPGLPRLRGFQRRQLAVTLAWAARRLDLPPPGWVEAL